MLKPRSEAFQNSNMIQDNIATQISHQILRLHLKDNFDPFFVFEEEEDAFSCHCFYYSVIFSTDIILLYDNGGRGGMCDLSTFEELSAMWKAENIYKHFNTSYSELQNSSKIKEINEIPKPLIDFHGINF